jgi:hypothetical protein
MRLASTDRSWEADTSERDSVTMSETEVAAFLAGARTLNVATLSPDGTIHLVAMWFVMHGHVPGLLDLLAASG